MSTELMVVEKFALPPMLSLQDMAEEMDGLSVSFDRVKIPSGGGLAFEVPAEDGADVRKELVGVIIDHHPCNAYWKEHYAGKRNHPDCSSMDAKTGVGDPGGDCRRCPFNQWGSAIDGRGKACKNMHRVYILLEGEFIPLLLTLPPTSIQALGNYLAKRVLGKGKKSYEVVTKIGLEKATNANGIEYSRAVFSCAGALSQEAAEQMKRFAEQIRPLTRRIEITEEDYDTGGGTIDAESEEVF